MQRFRFGLLTVLLVLTLLLSLSPVTKTKSALADIPDKMVTLTFDDGPDPRFTVPLLDLLQKEHLHATFFVVGKNALQHPDLIQRMVREGHTLGNHTLTHPHLEQLSPSQVRDELGGADAALTDILGPARQTTHYFRPPRGKVSPAINDTVTELNKEMVLWNVCVENHTTTTPEQVRQRVGKLIDERNGGILLAHDGELDRTLTMKSLPLILDDLKRKGYHLVPLDVYLKARDQQKTTRSQ